MAKGRRPSPTKLRVVQGNRGKRPINKKEPKPLRKLPPAPEHLTAIAREAWDRFAPMLFKLGVLTEADVIGLERLAECYAEVRTLAEVIEKEGHTYETTTQTGDMIVRRRPESAQLADADKRLRAYLVEFGLTPAARSKVTADPNEEEHDPAEDYF